MKLTELQFIWFLLVSLHGVQNKIKKEAVAESLWPTLSPGKHPSMFMGVMGRNCVSLMKNSCG